MEITEKESLCNGFERLSVIALVTHYDDMTDTTGLFCKKCGKLFDKLKDESCWSCGWNGKSIEREVLFESYEVDEFVEVDGSFKKYEFIIESKDGTIKSRTMRF